jgi:hypothetical protein
VGRSGRVLSGWRGSVSRVLFPPPWSGRVTAIPLGPRFPGSSSGLTRGTWERATPGGTLQAPPPSYSALLRVGFTEHPGSPRGLVSSYLTVSPLLALPRGRAGGLLSVALSPDRSGPPLAATLPCGARTFLRPRLVRGRRPFDPLRAGRIHGNHKRGPAQRRARGGRSPRATHRREPTYGGGRRVATTRRWRRDPRGASRVGAGSWDRRRPAGSSGSG